MKMKIFNFLFCVLFVVNYVPLKVKNVGLPKINKIKFIKLKNPTENNENSNGFWDYLGDVMFRKIEKDKKESFEKKLIEENKGKNLKTKNKNFIEKIMNYFGLGNNENLKDYEFEKIEIHDDSGSKTHKNNYDENHQILDISVIDEDDYINEKNTKFLLTVIMKGLKGFTANGATVKPNWQCPIGWRTESGTCSVSWNCTITEW